jgi:hypothetical protein
MKRGTWIEYLEQRGVSITAIGKKNEIRIPRRSGVVRDDRPGHRTGKNSAGVGAPRQKKSHGFQAAG